MNKQTNYAHSIFFLLMLLCFIAVATVVKLTASFCIPLMVAILLSFVMYPFCQKLKRIHVPWGLSIVLSIVIAFVLFYFLGSLLVSSLKTIVTAYPRYESRFTSIYKIFAEKFKIPFDEELGLFSNLWNSLNVRNIVQNIAITLSGSLVSVLKVILMIVLLIVFLLLEFQSLKLKIDAAFTAEETHKTIVTIAHNIITEVTHFLSIKFIVSLMTGFLVFVGTFVINMDFPIVWGFLAFVLNFIPNFGSIISCGLTVLFAILQFYPSWEYIIYVVVMVLVVNMVLGNIVEPRWEGTDLGISPFIILVSLSFWGWMWGFVGMILAVPLMVVIKIVCENIDSLRPIAILLGNGPKKKEKDEASAADQEVVAASQETL